MNCECNNVLTYKKAIPDEIIDIGDIIMLDVESGLIKRAVLERPHCDFSYNSRLVVGICVGSDNVTEQPVIIDGGTSEYSIRTVLDGGDSTNIQRIEIIGGDSTTPTSTIISVAYSGVQDVNTTGFIKIGNQLCISSKPGKAQSKDFHGKEFYDIRSMGRVIKIPEKDKATIILDIE